MPTPQNGQTLNNSNMHANVWMCLTILWGWRLKWYSHKLLDHGKVSRTDVFETASQKAVQKTVEASSDFISNKIADTITLKPKLSVIPKNSEFDEKSIDIPKERCIPQEKNNTNYWLTWININIINK